MQRKTSHIFNFNVKVKVCQTGVVEKSYGYPIHKSPCNCV